jgi:DNA-binding MarR family transcriptional regulator
LTPTHLADGLTLARTLHPIIPGWHEARKHRYRRVKGTRSHARRASSARGWAERLLVGHEPPLTVTQYLALRAISEDEVPAAELARRAAVSGPAVSQVLAGLGETGLIQRTPVPSGRWQALTLSAKGQRLFRSAQVLLRDRFSELLDELFPETGALAHALPHVAAALPAPRRRAARQLLHQGPAAGQLRLAPARADVQDRWADDSPEPSRSDKPVVSVFGDDPEPRRCAR